MLKLISDEHVDNLCVAETKINKSFPAAQFSWPGYHKPYRLSEALMFLYVETS